MSWSAGSEEGSSAAALYAGAETLYCQTGRERVKKLCAGDTLNDDLMEKITSSGFPDAKKGESASGSVFYGEKRRELYFVLRTQAGTLCRALRVSIGDAAARAGKAVVSECSADNFVLPASHSVTPLPPETLWGGVKVKGAAPELALHSLKSSEAGKDVPAAALPLPDTVLTNIAMTVTGGGSSRSVTCLADVRHLERCGSSGNFYAGADIALLPGEVLEAESRDGKSAAKVFITDGKTRIPAWYSDLRLLEKGGKGQGISDFALASMEPPATFAGFSNDTLYLAVHENGTEGPVTAISVSPRMSPGLDGGASGSSSDQAPRIHSRATAHPFQGCLRARGMTGPCLTRSMTARCSAAPPTAGEVSSGTSAPGRDAPTRCTTERCARLSGILRR